MNREVRLARTLLVLLVLLCAGSLAFAQQEEKPIFCPPCGAALPATAKFCTKCGAKLPAPVAPGGAEEAAPEPAAPVPTEEPALEVTIVPPADLKAQVPTADQIRAEALHDRAMGLFARGQYALAAGVFSQVLEEYPSTPCAQAAPVMIQGCYKAAAVERGRLSRPESKQEGGSALGEGFVGGCLGVGVALALLAAVASAGR